jgi:hypothetical protein
MISFVLLAATFCKSIRKWILSGYPMMKIYVKNNFGILQLHLINTEFYTYKDNR